MPVKAYHFFFLFFSLPVIAFSQTITTYAGGITGHGGFWGDGSVADSAEIGTIVSVAFDTAGNLFIPTPNSYRIRRVNKNTRIITTYAGNGNAGFSGDGGTALLAQFDQVGYIAFDSKSNLYLSDFNNHRIRKIDAVTNIISTIAGDGIMGYNGDSISAISAHLNYPAGLCFDKYDNLYIADNGNHRIRKITSSGIVSTYVGIGTSGYNGDGILATTAQISDTRQMCIDSLGNLYIGDIGNGRVRKIDVVTHLISTIVGTGDSNYYNGDGILANAATIDPFGLTLDRSGNIIIADHVNNRIRMVDVGTGKISTVAGNGIKGFSGDKGLATVAEFYFPTDICFDKCNNLYVADNANKRIRKVAFDTTCGHGDTTDVVTYVNEDKIVNTYPSPASNILYLSTTIHTAKKECFYQIIDLTGRVQLTGSFLHSKQAIDISNLVQGVYFIQIRTGQESIRKKFVKE